MKREKKHQHEAPSHARLQDREYTVSEMKSIIDEMSGQYALARVVDPIECRVLELGDDGRIHMNESGYGIWDARQKCLNCSSALACRTGCHQMKREQFNDQVYSIQSNPISLRLAAGGVYEIDDFGRGYFSLSMLKDIRADVLKIDMSFLSEILENSRSCIILESVISLAESLGMEVITEGVETGQQLATLTAMDCSHFQGYYFSKPVPVEEFETKC